MSDSMCYTRKRLEILDKAQLIEIILENFSVPLEAKSSKSQVSSSCDKPSTKAPVNSTSNSVITPITSNKKLKYPKQNNKNKHSTKYNANWSLPEPDWNTANFRKVALKFAYLGKEFDGLQIQTESNNTIESHLWEAIVGCKLRPGDCMPGPNYTRCARTDKGVSAFEQVITMELKSNLERRFSDNSRPVESRVSHGGGVDPNRDTLSWGHDVEFLDRINCSHYFFNEIKILSADFKSALKIG